MIEIINKKTSKILKKKRKEEIKIKKLVKKKNIELNK